MNENKAPDAPLIEVAAKATKTLIRPDRCEKCKFATARPGEDRFECHRNPPMVTAFLGPTPSGHPQVLNSTAFPIVQSDQWCAEFVPRVMAS